jgi:carboxymethylenebutenolidase
MAFQDYVAEEIAVDHRDGFVTRREALRRLALIGFSAGAASALLAACSDGDEEKAQPTTSSTGPTTSSIPGEGGKIVSFEITFPGPAGDLKGWFAPASAAKGNVLVIHENKGLTAHFRALPGRLAEAGYNALAVDLLSPEGGTASFPDEAKATAALTAAPRERLVADLRAGIDELERRGPGKKVGVMGFCFGGGMTWSLLAAGEARLAAAVPFYGPLPEGADFARAKAAVLAVYAELDARVNASRELAEAAIDRAGLTHEVVTYPGVDHAFFNDTGPRYNAPAAAEAYTAVLEWFGRYLT